MFESLTEKLQAVFDRIGKRGILREEDVDAVLREIRLALLEADVNYKVVKDFVAAWTKVMNADRFDLTYAKYQ